MEGKPFRLKNFDDDIYPFFNGDGGVQRSNIDSTELSVGRKGGGFQSANKRNGTHDASLKGLDYWVKLVGDENRKLVGTPVKAGDDRTKRPFAGLMDLRQPIKGWKRPSRRTSSRKGGRDKKTGVTEKGTVLPEQLTDLRDKPSG